MSAGQTEHFHGTNGTRPRDGGGPEVGVSRMFIGFFLFPILGRSHPRVRVGLGKSAAVSFMS